MINQKLDLVMDKLFRLYYPTCARVDTARVTAIKTKYGTFRYSPALQTYYNLFEQIEEYKIDDLTEKDVVLDIGACVGAFTVLVAPKVDSVIAVEPLFDEDLRQNVRMNNLENVTIITQALGSGPDQIITFCRKTAQVKNISFKEILKAYPSHPTYLKCDCEGGEWTIQPEDLTGFRAVEAEVHNFGGEDPMKFVEMLEKLGFSCKYSYTDYGQLMVSARR